MGGFSAGRTVDQADRDWGSGQEGPGTALQHPPKQEPAIRGGVKSGAVGPYKAP
jgi:hypothetical protein